MRNPTKTHSSLRSPSAPPLASSGLTADRPNPRESKNDSYPRSFLTLSRCSCARRSYPEPSFAYTIDDLDATAAIDADELDSGHYSPEHRPG